MPTTRKDRPPTTKSEALKRYLVNANDDLIRADAESTFGRREHALINVREDLENALAEIKWLINVHLAEQENAG